ncbi:MAG: M20/M25/M40 family metallo-hydrolase [Candidatus Nanopelagicales bacterium]|nr:M20/M25/M40 family metallo-hydrolase [Candidatus Nanopelagicales bacterium]
MTVQTPADRAQELAARVDALMPQVRADLEALVSIPSINFPGYDQSEVIRCANACAHLLHQAGAEPELIPSSSGVPTVRADIAGPAGSPTVLLYSHYDVQPSGDEAKWDSAPFTAEERDGRLYGRGAADDKSGVISHIAVLRAFDGAPPVSLRILFEGEEEYGGDFEEWPTTRPEVFADIDAAVIADMGNVRIGQPTFTTQLRGIIEGVVTVQTLAEPRHSGQFGGPAPDALMVLIKLLNTLMDAEGNCAVQGLGGSDWDGADFPEDAYRELAGVLPGVPLIGSGSIASRLYSKPSVTVVGLDAPEVATAPNAIIPMARAKISVRIPAGVDAEEATEALARHVRGHAPFGVAVDFEPGPPANGSAVPVGGPGYEAFSAAMQFAYGSPSTQQGIGGAVPFVANLLEAFPDLEVLGVGAQDPLARIHAPNESIHLKELRDSIVAEALFLQNLADGR